MTAGCIRELDTLDFSEHVRAGDGVIWGQFASEPTPLVRRLLDQRAQVGGFSAFLGATSTDILKPEFADHVKFRAIGGIGNNRVLARAGVLEVVPLQLSAIPAYIAQGLIPCDVAIVQARELPEGGYAYAVGSDYIVAAAEHARRVILEVNEEAPLAPGPHRIPQAKIVAIVRTRRQVLQMPPARCGEVERRIAGFVSEFIEDGATLQVGIGGVPEAVMALLRDRRDLGVHSGMIGDSVAELTEAGVITNARKPIDTGLTVTGMLAGTDRLYRFADRNPGLLMRSTDYTHDAAVLARLPKLVSINGAVEVDLTGQVNAEEVGGLHIGAVGGSLDYVRGGHRSPGGHSIFALPSTTADGRTSRVVGRLDGPVSTPRSDADVVVTEHGVARLRGRSLRERAKAMLAIAHLDHREALERAAHEQFGTP
jgi:acyl-CoA hydrolase